MITQATMQTCLTQLGDLNDDIASIEQGEDGDDWEIEMADGSVIEIEFDGERQRMALSSALGAPDPDRRAHTCEMLLTFNLLWQEDMPVRMAVGSPGEDVVLVADVPLPDTITGHDLQAWFDDFAASARHWRPHVVNGFHDVEDAPALFLESGAFRA